MEYADDIALMSNNAQAIQHALDHLEVKASGYATQFTSSKFKVFQQQLATTTTTSGDYFEMIKYYGSLTTASEHVEEGITSRQFSRTCGACGVAMTSGFFSGAGCIIPQWVEFTFTAVRGGFYALKLVRSFLYLTISVSEALYGSGGNIKRAMMRCVVMLGEDSRGLIGLHRIWWLG